MYITNVLYRAGDLELRGIHVARELNARSLPAVVIFHDARGAAPNPAHHIEKMLEAGFGVFIADMFGAANQPTSLEQGIAACAAVAANRETWRSRAFAALDAVARIPGLDAKRVAAVGYCFGGSTALELALAGASLRAAVSIHGGLGALSLDAADKVQCAVLVCSGAEDPLVPAEHMSALQDAFRKARLADWQVLTLAGAKHSYTNPDAPESPATGYHVLADRRSLAATLALLNEVVL